MKNRTMGKNKLSKFADMDGYEHVFQYPFAKIAGGETFPLKGKWNTFFGNDNPIVLELGCGRGEYTVGLAKRFAEKNYIGVDIKGARMWTGAKESHMAGMKNVAFLRTDIELISHFFAEGEVSEIWITFPDPQMKKVRKRLTSTRFMELYQGIMKNNGIIHLKTDSPFLYTYTKLMVNKNGYNVLMDKSDLYADGDAGDILSIQTYYESQWIARGLSIKYLAYNIEPRTSFVEPDEEIEFDSYRSYNRSRRGANNTTIE